MAVSETFASVTGLEYAYTKAPASLKSLVMSIFLLQSAFGSALGVLLAPFAEDPNMVRMYIGLCIATIVAAGFFWMSFKHLNATEESMNTLENKGRRTVSVDDTDVIGALHHSTEGRSWAAASEAEV